MSKDPYQADFLNTQNTALSLPDADIEYTPDFIDQHEAIALYEELVADLDWRQEVIKVYGKSHPTPRLSCWMGETGLPYGYSQTAMEAMPWSATILNMKQALEVSTKTVFNSVLINYYRDGRDSVGWHSDDEPEFGKNPLIASVSLGASRDFHLRHKQHKLTHKMPLNNGSLLIMKGPTRHYWQHHIPKRAHAQGRVNLTFRTFKAAGS